MVLDLRRRVYYQKAFYILALGVFFPFWLCIHNSAWAQEKGYPSKPIKIIVPYDPGGVIDLSVRVMTDALALEFKVPIIIENRSGAGGMLGASLVAKAKPDGYTILGSSDSTMIIQPLVSPNPPFDPFRDFLAICAYGVTPTAFGVFTQSPFKAISDFVKYAKQNPGKINCAVSSVGSGTHLALEVFRKGADVNIKLVPYKGTGEAIAALLGKHVDMLAQSYVGFAPYIKSGEVRILAVTDSVPGASIPTLSERGYSQVQMGIYNTFFISANTPKPIYEKLVHGFERVAKNPDLGKKWEGIGLTPTYKNPVEYDNYLKEKWQIVSKLVEELGLKGN